MNQTTTAQTPATAAASNPSSTSAADQSECLQHPEIQVYSKYKSNPDWVDQMSFLEDLRLLKLEIMNNVNDVVNRFILEKMRAERNKK